MRKYMDVLRFGSMLTGTALLGAVLLGSAATAQDAPLETVTVEGLVEALKPPEIITRGARISPRKVDLAVGFAYNSADLTPDARETLRILAESMKHPTLASIRFRIAGHTDAVGSDAYNLELSRARAASVVDFLTGEQGIAAARLEGVGLGESQLLVPNAPEDGRNRRVEVIAVD